MEEHGDVTELLFDCIYCANDVVLVRKVTFKSVSDVTAAVNTLHQHIVLGGVDVDTSHFGAQFRHLKRQIASNSSARSEYLES